MTPALGDELIRLDRATCQYTSEPVLVNIDLKVAAGQFTGIVGPSGSGKTTLLRLLMGTVQPLAGSVHRRRGLRMAYVPQVDTVNWSFPVTAGECVLMARTRGRRLPWSSSSERDELAEVFARLGIDDVIDRHIRELSGGQQQRVFIARALLQQAELLLLDEPTSGVDLKLRHDILHLLGDLRQEGLGILLTTHDLNGVATHLPHVICLNGEIVGAGTPVEVLTPEVLERTYGASMDVLQHGGVCVVVDRQPTAEPHHVDNVVSIEKAVS